jgi:hypothetical protein
MKPLRAFLFALTAGLAILFGGHGVFSTVLAQAPDVRIGSGEIQVPVA